MAVSWLILAVCVDSAWGARLKANSWQARLDKSLLSVDLGVGSRLRLFNKAVKDPALREDVGAAVAIIQDKGFGKGHPEVIQKLWPTGTTARADLEGLTALRKQVPEALRELQKSPPSLSPPPPSGTRGAVAPDPSAVLSSLVTIVTDKQKQKELKEEVQDLLRSTPKGLETPKYKVVDVVDGPLFLGQPESIEIREYEQFTVAKTTMASAAVGSTTGGAGFTTLASYLFGENEAKMSMAMTMPVEISSMPAGEGSSMAFVLPKRYADAPPPPLTGSKVSIAEVPARLVAAKAFAGIVTEDEVTRQKAALLEALASNGTYAAVDEGQMSVLQYNSPLAVPWRRRNEVAVVVTATKQSEGAGADEDADADADDGVQSWYDAGARL